MPDTPRILTRPTPGFYTVRLVPRGWPVAARISLDDDRYSVTIDGKPVPRTWTEEELESDAVRAITTGTLFDHPLLRVNCFGQMCDETEYRHKLATRAWAEANAPWHPSLHPEKPIDLRLLPAEDF